MCLGQAGGGTVMTNGESVTWTGDECMAKAEQMEQDGSARIQALASGRRARKEVKMMKKESETSGKV